MAAAIVVCTRMVKRVVKRVVKQVRAKALRARFKQDWSLQEPECRKSGFVQLCDSLYELNPNHNKTRVVDRTSGDGNDKPPIF